MITPTNCPRCRSTLPANALFCSRCGLTIAPNPDAALAVDLERDAGHATPEGRSEDEHVEVIEPFDYGEMIESGTISAPLEHATTYMNTSSLAEPTFLTSEPAPVISNPGTPTENLSNVMPQIQDPTSSVAPSGSLSSPPTYGNAQRNTGPIVYTEPLTSNAAVALQGALELLPQENVVYQLGALYLTNKRVILLAPTVVRSAFVRDIDAVGTMTERASMWHIFFSLLFLMLSIGFIYASTTADRWQNSFPWVYRINPLFTAVFLGLVGLFLLARYFLWVKRSLFVSVKGRPLITVSMSDWNSQRLAGMDSFVNAFFQVKDFLSGDLTERPVQ